MPHRHAFRMFRSNLVGARILAVGLPLVALVGCGKKGLEGPEAEVKATTVKVDLPPVPDFSLPPATDGGHSVKELRVKGKKLLDTDITVKGVITWAYDCATAIRTTDQTDEQVAKIVEETPDKCERPKFYIGDSADTPIEKSLWVVDVPRPFNKIELKNNPKEMIENPEPDRCDGRDPKKKLCPVYKVGDTVTITGSFKLSSPHSERNSDGLLVYKVMKNETQAWDSPPPKAETPSPDGAKPSPEDLTKKKPG